MASNHQHCRQVRTDKHARTECEIDRAIGSIADSLGEQARNFGADSKYVDEAAAGGDRRQFVDRAKQPHHLERGDNMKAKRTQAKIVPVGAGHGATGSQISMSKPPAFVMRLPLPVKLGAHMKSSQTVFEKVVDGRRFRVVQTVVANAQAKTPATTRGFVRRVADWPSIPAVAVRKRWVH